MSGTGQDELRAQLARLFREELQDNLSILASGVAELEDGPDRAVEHELVPLLFRAAHSLKGAAHSAGIAAAVEPCRRLEEGLALLRDGERILDDEMLAAFAHAVDELVALDRQMGDPEPATPDDESSDPPGSRAGSGRPAQATADPRARVDVSALDELVGRAGVLVSATARLHVLAVALAAERDVAQPGAPMARLADEVGAIERQFGHSARQVIEAAQELRMQRIDDVTAGLEHTVRELARSMGKQAELSVLGGDLKVDRDVGDALREPLLHLVRNAIDHGLELPDERAERGKRSVGTVRIEATLEGGRVRVAVADDGRGIDVAALRALAGDQTDDDSGDLDLAFRAGVSTASAVSDISGRGVGLDAVRERVESLGGTVHLQNGGDEDGVSGARAVIRVPTTLAVVRIVLVSAGGELVGLPAGAVERAHRVDPSDVQLVDGRLLLLSDEGPRPAVVLAGVLDLPMDGGGDAPLTVIELTDENSVLLVDRVDSELEGVLERLPPRATGVSVVLGAVILPSDRPATVVNPAACVRSGARAVAPSAAAVTPDRPVVLLAEDTLTTRALERSILVGAGYEVIDVGDGADAWQVLTERAVDVVVSDVDMPRMGGIELCRSIRSSVRLGHIPVVLVTSLSSEDDRRRGVEAGANAYLVKSAFDQAALLDAVRRVL